MFFRIFVSEISNIIFERSLQTGCAPEERDFLTRKNAHEGKVLVILIFPKSKLRENYL